MADLLAQVGDLSTLLGQSLDAAEEQFILELATSAVQAAAGQRLVRTTDNVELLGRAEHWLELPERPVETVSSVTIDGDPVVDFLVRRSRLWRDQGWSQPSNLVFNRGQVPSLVSVTYTHGYDVSDQAIEFARQVTLAIAAQLYANPEGATGFSIDDYRENYSQATGGVSPGAVPKTTQVALRRRYGLATSMLVAT